MSVSRTGPKSLAVCNVLRAVLLLRFRAFEQPHFNQFMLRTLAFKAVQLIRHRKGLSLRFIILALIAHDQPAALSRGIPMMCYSQIGVHPVPPDAADSSRPPSCFDLVPNRHYALSFAKDSCF